MGGAPSHDLNSATDIYTIGLDTKWLNIYMMKSWNKINDLFIPRICEIRQPKICSDSGVDLIIVYKNKYDSILPYFSNTQLYSGT